MFERAKYKELENWRDIPDPVATIKYDGANFWMPVSEDGSLRFISRRPSVKGGYPDRTDSLPHLTERKLPELAGHVYNVELIHTGHDPSNVDSHRIVSGILNSLPPRAIETQRSMGPVRAVLHNVVNPEFSTYKEKLLHMKKVQDIFGKPDVLFVAHPRITHSDIQDLIEETRRRRQEGVIITSLSKNENENPRIKIKHKLTYNLRVVDIIQEEDINGRPKPSMGALIVEDASGAKVARVGTGFSRAQRKEAWEQPGKWIGKVIQVETMGLAAKALRMPVYNGDADGEVDFVF